MVSSGVAQTLGCCLSSAVRLTDHELSGKHAQRLCPFQRGVGQQPTFASLGLVLLLHPLVVSALRSLNIPRRVLNSRARLGCSLRLNDVQYYLVAHLKTVGLPAEVLRPIIRAGDHRAAGKLQLLSLAYIRSDERKHTSATTRKFWYTLQYEPKSERVY